MLSHPDSARKGNLLAAFGMFVAILGTIFLTEYHGEGFSTKLVWIGGAIAIGTIAGWVTAMRVQMTKMPELVSLFNGMGGACAALIGLMEYNGNLGNTMNLATIIAGMIIGSVSFSGSIVAFLKLNGTLRKPIRLPFYNIINTIVMVGLIAFAIWAVMTQAPMTMIIALFILALVYGLLFVFPIGGADMPVVISLLNSSKIVKLVLSYLSIFPAIFFLVNNFISIGSSLFSKILFSAFCNGSNFASFRC